MHSSLWCTLALTLIKVPSHSTALRPDLRFPSSSGFLLYKTNVITQRACTCSTLFSCSCCETVTILRSRSQKRLCSNYTYQRNGLNVDITLGTDTLQTSTITDYQPFKMCTAIPGSLFSSICLNIVELNQYSRSLSVCVRHDIRSKTQEWQLSYSCLGISTLLPMMNTTTDANAMATMNNEAPTEEPEITMGPAMAAATMMRPPMGPAMTMGPAMSEATMMRPPMSSAMTMGPAVNAATIMKPPMNAATAMKPSMSASMTMKPSMSASMTMKPSMSASTTMKPSMGASTTMKPSMSASMTMKPSMSASTTMKPSLNAATAIKPSMNAATKPSMTMKPAVNAVNTTKATVSSASSMITSSKPSIMMAGNGTTVAVRPKRQIRSMLLLGMYDRDPIQTMLRIAKDRDGSTFSSSQRRSKSNFGGYTFRKMYLTYNYDSNNQAGIVNGKMFPRLELPTPVASEGNRMLMPVRKTEIITTVGHMEGSSSSKIMMGSTEKPVLYPSITLYDRSQNFPSRIPPVVEVSLDKESFIDPNKDNIIFMRDNLKTSLENQTDRLIFPD